MEAPLMAYLSAASVLPFRQPTARPRNARRVPPAVLRGLRGIGDYSVIAPTGARVAYGGPAPVSPTYVVPGSTPPATFPPGALLRATGVPANDSFDAAAVFVINSDGTRSWIPDPTTFAALGYSWSAVQNVPYASLQQIPLGPTASAGASQITNAGSTTTPTTLSPVAGTVVTTIQPGASYNASTGIYTNPDGTIVYGAGAYSTPTSLTPTSGTVVTTIEPGATYNAQTGIYTNPDGTLVYSASLSTSGTIDWTSPSTWPFWVWGAIAAGIGAIALFKHK
jgi:hypothetical protein